MKKTLVYTAMLIAMVLTLVGCNPSQESQGGSDADSYMTCPFAKGTAIEEPSFDISNIVGTYLFGEYASTGYSFVSFLEDGTLLKTDAVVYSLDPASEVYEGTWSLADGKITIAIEGINYENADYETVDGDRFRIKKSTAGSATFYSVFLKETDEVMDKDVYSDSSKLAGLWGISDDYGDVTGYRFTKGGYVYRYSTKNSTFKNTWQISNRKAEIKMTTLDGVSSDTYGIVLCGDYLYLGLQAYRRIE